MNTIVQDAAETSDECELTATVEILQPRILAGVASAGQLSIDDDECVGFDPYDTASLYLK